MVGVEADQLDLGMERGRQPTQPNVLSHSRSREKEGGLGCSSGSEPGCEVGGTVPDPENISRDGFKVSHDCVEQTMEIRSLRTHPAAAECRQSITELDRMDAVLPKSCRPLLQGTKTERQGVSPQAGFAFCSWLKGERTLVYRRLEGNKRREVAWGKLETVLWENFKD